jgi:hypothetical protein
MSRFISIGEVVFKGVLILEFFEDVGLSEG